MFTPAMTREEIEKEARQDYLEISWKVETDFEKFRQKVFKLPAGNHNMFQYATHKWTVTTKRHNTWQIECFCNPTPNKNHFQIGYHCYYVMHRGENLEYIFLRGRDKAFMLDILTDHFLQRYKERYLIPNNVNLKGQSAGVFFERHSYHVVSVKYIPKDWTTDDLKSKNIWMSEQGLFVTSHEGMVRTFITFLDQENLTRYKAQVLEGEQFMQLFMSLQPKSSDSNTEYRDKMLKFQELYKRPNAKEILANFIRRAIPDDKKKCEKIVKDLLESWDEFAKMSNKFIEVYKRENRDKVLEEMKKERESKEEIKKSMRLLNK